MMEIILFSISYRINYALSNSHHNVEFKDSDRIHINDLFVPLIDMKSDDPRGLHKIKQQENRLIKSENNNNNPYRIRDEKPIVGSIMKYKSSLVITEPESFRKEKDTIKELKSAIEKLSEKI